MTGIDTNILIDLIVKSMPGHDVATSAMSELHDEVCTTATNVAECLRLLTHSKVFQKPLKLQDAVGAIDELFLHYRIRVLEEDANWWRDLVTLAQEVPGLKGNEIFDARIALCLRARNVKRLYTRDADFKKFTFIKAIHFVTP